MVTSLPIFTHTHTHTHTCTHTRTHHTRTHTHTHTHIHSLLKNDFFIRANKVEVKPKLDAKGEGGEKKGGRREAEPVKKREGKVTDSSKTKKQVSSLVHCISLWHHGNSDYIVDHTGSTTNDPYKNSDKKKLCHSNPYHSCCQGKQRGTATVSGNITPSK